MRHDFVTYYSDQWLEDAIRQKGCKNEKEYFNKTLIDDTEELKQTSY